jgi:type IX secretion system PorP/SprF family membrane protein
MGSRRLHAQDPHFSQYFSSPLTVNPAFTGYFDGMQRFTMNLRSSWANGGDRYTTGTASFDTKIFKNLVGSNDRWGLGVHALYDQSGAGVFKDNYFSLSTGFNKGLDADGDQSIGIGVQATLGSSYVDFSKISFSNQFTGNGFDLSVPSGETINNRSVNFFDLNAGILYNYKDQEGNQFSFGGSIYHLLQPKLLYFSASNNALQPRYTLHTGANFLVGGNNSIFLSANAMQQNGAHEYVFGGAYGLAAGNTDISIYLGAWLRTGSAIYPYIGLSAQAFQLGLSYDIINADIGNNQHFSGSTELSFIYFFSGNRKKGIPCFF